MDKNVLNQPNRFKKAPQKRKGQAKGRRKISGEILDVTAVAELLGVPEGMIRARVARQQLPFRRWAGRIIFIRAEVMQYLEELDGVSVDEALANEKARREKVA